MEEKSSGLHVVPGQMQDTLRWAFNDLNGVHDLKIDDAGVRHSMH